MYRTPEQVPGKFVEVALLTPSDAPITNRYAMASLRKKAGELGANAILLLPAGSPTSARVGAPDATGTGHVSSSGTN